MSFVLSLRDIESGEQPPQDSKTALTYSISRFLEKKKAEKLLLSDFLAGIGSAET